MYVTPEMIAAAEKRYGTPSTYTMSYSASDKEIAIVRGSQKKGRKHDITMAIFGPTGVIVIAKPWYTHGLYRLPSGGLVPGETIEDGFARELWEETGVTATMMAYHVRIDVEFVGVQQTIPWTSHVFSARYDAGEVEPHDTVEIREARWCPIKELLDHRKLLLESTVSGFHYRAALQDKLLQSLEERKWLVRSETSLELTLPSAQGT